MKKNNTIFIEPFSEEIYNQTYKYNDDGDINGTHERIAKDLASKEKNKEYWTDQFLELLEDFKFAPGGRITSNAGTGLKKTTYINCFVSQPLGSNQDSMEGILGELQRQAFILKSEGGYGTCASFMRPRGTFVEGIGNSSPGAVAMLDMWDTQSAVITQGSGIKNTNKKTKQKVRKGAMMLTMHCWHPDIEEFIVVKQTPGKLTKANLSVLITDKFMDAVKEDKNWNLEFPDIHANKEIYTKEWNGDIESWKSKKYPIKIYKTIKARELWETIMKSNYNRNEPGVLFIDTVNKMNNLYWLENIMASNPCGEQVLPPNGSCLLGSINLTQFIKEDMSGFDYDKLKKYIPAIVRLMDNVIDNTNMPLEEQLIELKNKRRIGCGYVGYGTALLMMKIRYGSERALKMTNELASFVTNELYKASAMIAKEKGAFPLFDRDKYLSGEFVKVLNKDTIKLIYKYGLRNSHLTSIQPTGNTSIFINNVSGGLEPLFMFDYIRTSMQPYPEEGLSVPKMVDWENKIYKSDSEWKWVKEGDQPLLAIKYNGIAWKFDKDRGLLKETRVVDYGVRYLENKNEWDATADYAANVFNLNLDDHIKTMAVFAKYIDSAMSKTINLPKDFPFEDFKKLYEDIHATGVIKGATTYREGTMTAVLSKDSSLEAAIEGIRKTNAKKRPKSLDCSVGLTTVNGEKWITIISTLDKDPYEVFAFKNNDMINKSMNGKLIRVKSRVYDLHLDDGTLIENIHSKFESDEQEAVTRMTSMALRHGADVEFVVTQLLKSEGNITSFSKAVGRALKKYIKEIKTARCEDCGSKNIIMSEGCFKCSDCGSSKCE